MKTILSTIQDILLSELPKMIVEDDISVDIEYYVSNFFTEMIKENQDKVFPEECIDSLLEDIVEIAENLRSPLYNIEGSVKLYSGDGLRMVEFLPITDGHLLSFAKIFYRRSLLLESDTNKMQTLSRHHWFVPEKYCTGLYGFSAGQEIKFRENEYLLCNRPSQVSVPVKNYFEKNRNVLLNATKKRYVPTSILQEGETDEHKSN